MKHNPWKISHTLDSFLLTLAVLRFFLISITHFITRIPCFLLSFHILKICLFSAYDYY